MQILYSYLTYCPLLRKNMPVPFSERKILLIIKFSKEIVKIIYDETGKK